MGMILNIIFDNHAKLKKEDQNTILFCNSPVYLDDIKRLSNKIIWGGDIINLLRVDVRNKYLNTIAEIGDSFIYKNISFKEKLSRKGGNYWFYHPITLKWTGQDWVYENLLYFYSIMNEINKGEYIEIKFYGGNDSLKEIFNNKNYRYYYRYFKIVIKGVLSRIKWLLSSIIKNIVSKIFLHKSKETFRCLLHNYYNWGINFINRNDYKDNYFDDLYSNLDINNLNPCYLLDLEIKLDSNLGQSFRKLNNSNINKIFIDHYTEIHLNILEFFNLTPLYYYIKLITKKNFYKLFEYKGYNCFPIFKYELLSGFISGRMPKYKSLEVNYNKIIKAHRPNVFITYLELFLSSRSIYNCTKKYINFPVSVTMEHSSYNNDKTIVKISEREIEKYQNINFPLPDYIFCMGKFTYDIYANYMNVDKLFITGSARYNYSNLNYLNHQSSWPGIRVLLLLAIESELEIDMIIGATEYSKSNNDIKITVRDHPHGNLNKLEYYNKNTNFLKKDDSESLEQAFMNHDIILFTYSTSGIEAFLSNKITWQWAPRGFNASALNEFSANQVVINNVNEFDRYINIFRNDKQKLSSSSAEISRVRDNIFSTSKYISMTISNKIKEILD